MKTAFRRVLLLWLAWAVLLCGFQWAVAARIRLARPDDVLSWTAAETTADAHRQQPYLLEPFLNDHVAWDSEFYLSIAVAGYDDPLVRTTGPADARLSLNYAFMPFYPLVTRIISWPLRVFGLTPIATATLAGVLVSLLGALGGMLALYDLAREEFGESGGLRAAFYLVAFPTGFFLAQVHTEGLFVGLAFGCLALIRRKRFGWAALLAVGATWTRAVGVALVIPLALPWLRAGDWMALDLEWRQIFFKGIPWKALGKGLLRLAPLLAFVVWRMSYLGASFNTVEDMFFGRGFLSLGTSFFTWSEAFRSIFGANPETTVYYLIEFAAIALGLAACRAMWRSDPDMAAYSLAAIVLSLTSGPAQGMHRYILAAPVVFLFLARLGRHEVFDRAWSLASILLMGLLVTLFTFDFWVG